MKRQYNLVAEEFRPVAERLPGIARRAGKMPAWQIAEEVGLGVCRMRTIANQSGISVAYHKLKWTPHEESELLRLRDECGRSFPDIAHNFLTNRTGKACRCHYREMKAARALQGDK